MGELVAAVDVHAVGDGAEAVCGVEVAVPGPGVVAAPESLAAVGELDAAQVVEVAALGVEDLAEESLPHEVQAEELGAPVVDVFHHRAVAVRALGGLDELPAAFQRVGGGDFGDRVLAVLHGRDADGDVPAPGGRRVDEVEVLFGAEALEIGLAIGVERRARVPRLFDEAGRALRVLLADVADGGDHAAVDAHEIADVRRAHAADADVADAYLVDGGRGEGLAGRGADAAWDPRGSRDGSLCRAGVAASVQGASRDAEGAGLEEVPAVESAWAVWIPGAAAHLFASVVVDVACSPALHSRSCDRSCHRLSVIVLESGVQRQQRRQPRHRH